MSSVICKIGETHSPLLSWVTVTPCQYFGNSTNVPCRYKTLPARYHVWRNDRSVRCKRRGALKISAFELTQMGASGIKANVNSGCCGACYMKNKKACLPIALVAGVVGVLLLASFPPKWFA